MKDLLWVKIETTKGTDDTWCFKGQIEKTVFNRIVSNKLSQGYFKLDNVYWIINQYDDDSNSQEDILYQYGKDKLDAYNGELFLRIEHLVSIAPIDGEKELARLNKNDRSHLSLVTPIRSTNLEV